MKRNKLQYPIIKKYKSFFFWEECIFCKQEFRREQGFEILDKKFCHASNESPLYYSYCCSSCCTSIEEVKNKLDDIKKNSIINLLNKPKRPGQK